MNSLAQTSISVALLDPHRILRDGLECLIERSEGLSVVGSVATGGELSGCLELAQVDVVVMGLMGQGRATAAIARHMGISRKTVSTFKERIKVKLSLENSLQLTHIALQSLGRS